MRKQFLVNLALLLVVIGLGLVAWLDPFSKPEETPIRLTAVNSANVAKITLSRAGKAVVILESRPTATQPHWYLTQPLTIPANSARVNQLLGLLSANSFRQYRIKSDNLAKLGLQTPGWEIAFDAAGANTLVQFGKTEPISEMRYVLVNNTVHLIKDRYSQFNFGSPFMLANLDILPVDKSVTELHLPDKVIKKVDGQWQSTPDGEPISQDTYKEFIDEWRYAQALRVALADKPGLSSNAQAVTVVLEKADQPIHFTVEATDQDYIVTNKDWGVRYYLNSSVGEKLMQLDSPSHE